MPIKKTLHNEDVYSPNFDYYLELKIENITGDQLSLLENSVQHKILRHKGNSVGYMSLSEKMHILSIGFKTPVYIVVGENLEENSNDIFEEALKAQKGKIKNYDLLKTLEDNSIFVLGDKQISIALAYANHAQTSDIYNLLKINNPREKSNKQLRFDKKKEALNGLVDLLIKYESRKRRVIEQYDLNVPKFYGLLFFYQGERLCKDFYDKQFKHAYSKSREDLSKGQAALCRDGYLEKRGVTRELKYSITSKGIDLLMKVLSKMLYDL